MNRTRSHILALDQGTTSSRAIVFGALGQAVSVAQATWLGEKHVKTWPAPRPEDDGVTLLIEEIQYIFQGLCGSS